MNSHSLKSSHQAAEATKERNEQLRKAFGISESYTDGSSFFDRKKLEEKTANEEFVHL